MTLQYANPTVTVEKKLHQTNPAREMIFDVLIDEILNAANSILKYGKPLDFHCKSAAIQIHFARFHGHKIAKSHKNTANLLHNAIAGKQIFKLPKKARLLNGIQFA